jgi:hypothetical protein
MYIYIYIYILAFQHNQPCLKQSSITLDIVKNLRRGRTVTVQYLDSNGWTVTVQCLDSNSTISR